jgi:hypothetical protein
MVVEGSIIGSFDVVNLFNTTPAAEALVVVRKKLEEDKDLKHRTQHSMDYILEMISVCIYNTYFQ